MATGTTYRYAVWFARGMREYTRYRKQCKLIVINFYLCVAFTGVDMKRLLAISTLVTWRWTFQGEN